MTEKPNRLVKLVEEWWDSNWKHPNTYGFSLASGRGVVLEAFNMEETYAGLLEGVISEAENEARINGKINNVAKIWGRRATYVVPPTSRTTYRIDGRPDVRLPKYCYRAWLTSKEMNKKYYGSELVVIWFGGRTMELSLLAMVEQACRDVPWEKHARDFDW